MDIATSAASTTIKSPTLQTSSKSQLTKTNTAKTLAGLSGNTKDQTDYVNKWLQQYATKTPLQTHPKRRCKSNETYGDACGKK